MSSRPASAGFTLLELLLVLTIIGILVAVVLPSSDPAVYDQLRSTAQIVATDLAYARSLAVANNSNYRITYDLDANRYVMKHSGTNAALNQLPKSPFSSQSDTLNEHIVALADLPHAGSAIRLAAVATTGSMTQSVGNVEFGPLGQTDPTTIWLMGGSGDKKRYITVVVNAATGIAQVGEYTSDGPPATVTQVQ